MHPVVDGRVERRDDVGVEALAAVHGAPAHLVGRGVRPGGPALGRAVAVPEEVGARDELPRRRGQRVRAMPVRVPRARWAHLLLLLLPDRRQVPLVEEPRTDQLPAGGKTLIKQARQSILRLKMGSMRP